MVRGTDVPHSGAAIDIALGCIRERSRAVRYTAAPFRHSARLDHQPARQAAGALLSPEMTR